MVVLSLKDNNNVEYTSILRVDNRELLHKLRGVILYYEDAFNYYFRIEEYDLNDKSFIKESSREGKITTLELMLDSDGLYKTLYKRLMKSLYDIKYTPDQLIISNNN
jgi:hypothetical protein